MVTEYIHTAMHRAVYEILEDGIYYGEIPELEGLLASGITLEECRKNLQSALEDWLMFSLANHLSIPKLDDIQIFIPEAV
ncbi:MAG: type II toxin-antitoxin system HicB family antitoxin [Prochloron sp. SP5CPC1]|nr:type II toxin-antitoxin system HicB family antitoxin [Candidatus Paraprochloron terpiosi SP5CPC1]